MAKNEHVKRLEAATSAGDITLWNQWREDNRDIRPNFMKANLTKAKLMGANLRGADLWKANLSGANLWKANLAEANLSGANLAGAYIVGANLSKAKLTGTNVMKTDLRKVNFTGADLMRTNLAEANLSGADLSRANLARANLARANLLGANLSGVNLTKANLLQANLTRAGFSGANLSGANLRYSILVKTDLTRAKLTGCHAYGVSVWEVKLEGAEQTDLVITEPGEPVVTTDNLEVAQFIYLLLNNEKIRDVIDTITSKVVLILGRFGGRKQVLDRLRDELRKRNYSPILFDFTKPSSRSTDETIMLLARMARFVIADISDAKSVLQELRGIVPDCPSVPIQPLLIGSQIEPGMFDYFHKYHWFLKTYQYQNEEQLLSELNSMIIQPAEAKANEIRSQA